VHRPDPGVDIEEALLALTDLRRAAHLTHLSHERRIDAVEQLIPLADDAGIKLTHLAMAFAIAHPGVTTALVGPRTMEQLDDLLEGADVQLPDELLDAIDSIVPPGTDVGQLDMPTPHRRSTKPGCAAFQPIGARPSEGPVMPSKGSTFIRV